MTKSVAATFLFTDLVGSTALFSSVEPAEADAIRQTHFGLLRSAITASAGVEVKSLGDGLMAMFTSASRAVGCATAMQQAIDRHNRRGARPLSIRIGLSSGEVAEEDSDYFGDPVVEAARLCARAEGGQILATQLVRMTIGRYSPWEFVDVGPLELKGLSEPVPTVAIAWQPIDDAAPETMAIPLPPNLASPPPVAFVGRSEQVELLQAAWKDASGGARRVVFVAGEPGIGKTRLARELAVEVRAQGRAVLFGGCEEGLEVPYRPWIEALGPLVAHAGDDVIGTVGHRRLADLARVLPAVRDRVPDMPQPSSSDAETERYLFYTAVVALLSATAAESPVMLVLDDLHWVDRPSLALLRHVIYAPDCRGLLVVATYRDAEVGVDHPLADILADARRATGVDRVTLSGLADTEVLDLVETAAGSDVGTAGAEFAQALYRETDGNPFFAWEVMRHLAETGWVGQDAEGRWSPAATGEVQLPESVREVVGRRVRRLGPEVHATLSTAAVFGAEFELEPLSEALGAGPDEVLERIETAESSGLVRTVAPGTFRFAHAIVRHTLYEELSATRRARTHRQAAEALEALGLAAARPAELARHWAAAVTPSDMSKAVEYHRRAGDAALASLAPDQAAEHFRQALDLARLQGDMSEQLECALQSSLAAALCQAGDPAFREVALNAARTAHRLGLTDLLVKAVLVDYQMAASAYDSERTALLEAALEAVGPEDSPARARLLAALSAQVLFIDGEALRRYGQESIAIARRLGDRHLLMTSINNHGLLLWAVDERIDNDRESLTIAQELGDPAGIAVATHRVWHDSVMLGEIAQAAEVLDVCVAATAQSGRPDLLWILAYYRADWATMRGDLDLAEELTEQAWELGRRTGQPGAMVTYAAQLYMIRWQQGRPDEAAPVIAEAAVVDPNLSVLHLAAATDLRAAVANVPDDGAWLGAMGMLAERVARSGDRVLIETVYQQLMPHQHLFNKQGPLTLGPVAHHLAALSAAKDEREHAAHHFAAADALNQRLGFPFYTARTRTEWARMLLHDDPERAARLLTDAREAAVSHGYSALERRAARLHRQLL